jgi:hypothetical protein
MIVTGGIGCADQISTPTLSTSLVKAPGTLVIQTIDDTVAQQLTIQTGTSSTAATGGGDLNLLAGAGATTGTGGVVNITSGASDTGIGGAMNLKGGLTSGGTAAGGAVVVSGGISAGGIGGDVNINSGTGVTSGDVNITSYGLTKRWPRTVGVSGQVLAIDPALNTLSWASSQTVWKEPVLMGSTANITTFPPIDGISTVTSIDGISTSVGQRVLIKDQTIATENGIYLITSGTWTRSVDFIIGYSASGTSIYVASGSSNGTNIFTCTNVIGSDVVNTASLVFSPPVSTPPNESVDLATTVNIATTFPPSDGIGTVIVLDGISTVVGQRILVKNQTTASQNGIYLITSGTWTRAVDMAVGTSVAGRTVFVSNGDLANLKTFTCTSIRGNDVVGTDSLTFTYTNSISKQTVDLSTTDNIATTFPPTDGIATVTALDGVATVVGQRVLVKNQTTGSQNGIYLIISGTWQREYDLAVGSSSSGSVVFVSRGLLNAGKTFTCTNLLGSDIVATDALTWSSPVATWKQPVDLSTTVNITTVPPTDGISTVITLDGISTAIGQRVLIKDQTTQSDNGIYVITAGTWTRAVDMAVGLNSSGITVYVSSGAENATKVYSCATTPGSDIVGTALLPWITATAPSVVFGTTSIPDGQVVGTNTWNNITGSTFTLPKAGNYNVSYSLFSNIDTSSGAASIRLVNAIGEVPIANSFGCYQQVNATQVQQCTSITVQVQVSIATTFFMQISSSVGNLTVRSDNTLGSSNAGESSISWTQLGSSATTSAFSTLEYAFVRATSDQATGLSSGNPITFQTPSIDGTVSFSGGVFTLGANKTYLCQGGVIYTATGTELIYRWRNITNASFFGAAANLYNSSGGRSNIATGTITTTVPTTIQLEIITNIGVTNLVTNSDGRVPWAYVKKIADNNNISAFEGATTTVIGAAGYVPPPAVGQENSLLRGDGSWSTNGTVTQLTTIETPVTLNAKSGVITVFNSGVGGNTEKTFVFNNSFIKTDSVIMTTLAYDSSGNGSPKTYIGDQIAGSVSIIIVNGNGSTTTNRQMSIHFMIM